ncbi:T9SS type A sorting domain-containing protein [Saccharicrinis sp. FJH54]|uniref:T9SS type A sorting domain-containing protein n=1 Tax=Saccharicrinis sp. FJH54 TaxID=3344665 RepID=UPI0035D49EAB
MKRFALLFTVIFGVSLALPAKDIGSTAPNFTLDKLTGGNGMLTDYNGKVVFVFMFGYACPYCIGAAPQVKSQILETFKDNPDFVAIGIDTWNGSTSQVQNFKNSTSLDMTMYLKGGTVATSWETTYDRLIVIGADGKFKYIGTSGASSTITQTKSAIQEALNDVTTPIEEVNSEALKQNYPNPFRESTTIPFQLETGNDVRIEVLDLSGKNIKTLTEGFYPAGDHKVIFKNEGLKSGIYFYRIQTGDRSESRLMTVR